MNKRFECWNCGKVFDADDSHFVECPHCHSDNVDYATFHFPKWTKLVICGIFILPLLISAFNSVEWGVLMPKANQAVADGNTLTVEALTADSTFLDETGLTKPMTLIAGRLEFSDGGYSVIVSAKNVPNCSFKYVILEAFENKTVSESSDGKFDKIPPSKTEGGCYCIAAICTANDSLLAVIDMSGFIPQKKVTTRMTVQELQTKIDNRDPSLIGIGENDYLAPDYRLTFAGLSADAVNIPQVLAEVFEKIDNGAWLSVTVKDVGYDDMNRINMINMTVKEEDFDF